MRILEGCIDLKVYSTRTGMRRAIRRIGYGSKTTEAMVIPTEEYKFTKTNEYKTPLVAEVYLHKQATIPVICHEALHAATELMRSKRIKISLGAKIGYREEVLAYYQTWVIQEILKTIGKKSSDYHFTHENIKKWAKASISSGKKVNGKR